MFMRVVHELSLRQEKERSKRCGKFPIKVVQAMNSWFNRWQMAKGIYATLHACSRPPYSSWHYGPCTVAPMYFHKPEVNRDVDFKIMCLDNAVAR